MEATIRDFTNEVLNIKFLFKEGNITKSQAKEQLKPYVKAIKESITELNKFDMNLLISQN